MDSILTLIHEQLLDYSKQLELVEKEIVRKYKSGEDYSQDIRKAAGLKMMKEECLTMMAKNSLKK